MHKLLYRDGLTLEQAAQQIQGLGEGQDDLQPVVSLMTAFLQDVSPQRGIVR
jgi:hypothetical protein